MLRILWILVFIFTPSCSNETGKLDGSNTDREEFLNHENPSDGPGDFSNAQDESSGDSTSNDGPGFTSCDPDAVEDSCRGGLSCLCCGSTGARPICLCSKSCKLGKGCEGTELPFCNTPDINLPGICTPRDFNCCWHCQ